MTNNIEYFYKQIYQKSINRISNINEIEYLSLTQLLVNEFKNMLSDSKNFHNYLKYKLPSIDEMYAKNEIYDTKEMSSLKDFDQTEMHEEYISLLIDAFNIHNYNTSLGQMTLLLICRYYSETAEFIRNLDKMTLLFDENDWKWYQWIMLSIENFNYVSEKTNIWFSDISEQLEQNQSIDDFEIISEVAELDSILIELK